MSDFNQDSNSFGEPQQPQYRQGNYSDANKGNRVAGKILSIIGLVCGIISTVFLWVPLYMGLLVGLPGLIVSIIGKGQNAKGGVRDGKATAGLILSIIGLVGSIISFIVVFFVLSNSYYSYY
jgi:hypothetical protein